MSIRLKVVRAPQVDGTRHGKTRQIAGQPRVPRVEFPRCHWHGRTTALEMPGDAGMIGQRCVLRLLSFSAMVL
jgi:hypothetical protein